MDHKWYSRLRQISNQVFWERLVIGTALIHRFYFQLFYEYYSAVEIEMQVTTFKDRHSNSTM